MEAGREENMARLNEVRLYGIVTEDPVIHKDGKTDELLRGYCTVVVVARNVVNTNKPVKYDYPRILTRNPEQIAKMAKWKKNDVVEVKGSLTTKNMTKTKICSKCGERIKQPGTVVYVHPIFSEVRKAGLTQEQAIAEIKLNAEISNSATLMGVLCREPQSFRNERNGVRLTAYQLAVKRKFRIIEDPPETDVDFPWVKSYRDQGADDIKALHKGSIVLIDGKLQVRERDVKCLCPHCQAENEWKDYSMEVVPHSVEYLREFYSPEEISARESAGARNIIEEVFTNESNLDLPATKPEDYVYKKDDDKKLDEDEDIKAMIEKVFES